MSHETRLIDRPLRVEEAAVLRFLLTQDFPGHQQLLVQMSTARVTSECADGCGTIDLEVDRACAAAKEAGLVPIEASRHDSRGPLDVLLHVGEDGYLGTLEVLNLDSSPVRDYPKPEELTVFVRPTERD